MNNHSLKSHPGEIRRPRHHKSHLNENLLVIAGSIFAAILFAQSGVVGRILTQTKGIEMLASFIGGFFFTSLFTVAPATVVLGEIAQANSIIFVALFGGAGAVLGDLILLRFLKSNLTDDLAALFSHPKSERLLRLVHLNIFHWLLVAAGAVVIASPLPDELGLMLMGLSEIKLRYLIPLSFVLNSLGILVIAAIARGFL